jgi:serine phosphatase RsbU (regulator of sigma subunit)
LAAASELDHTLPRIRRGGSGVAHLRLFRGNQPQRIELTQDRCVFGRSHTCDVVLDSDAVSRRHACIERRGDVYILEDLGSRNKTFLNGNQITSAAELGDNDIIRICNHHIVFLYDSTSDSSKFQVIAKNGVDDSARIKLVHDARTDGSELGMDAQARINEKLQALLEINQAFSTICRSETLMTRVLDCLFRIFPQADRCYILTRNEPNGVPVPRASKNRNGTSDLTPRLSQSILHHVFDNGQALLAEDALHDPKLAQHGSVMANLIHSIMCAPLFVDDGGPVGAIWLHTEAGTRLFAEADLDVLVSVASMVGLGLQRARMHEQLLEHDRRLREAEAGRMIQQSFLPLDWPTVPGFRFYANCRPAFTVGGDYFSFLHLPNGRIAIALGDVSGTGMASALLMARLSGEVRFAAINSFSAAETVQALNRILQSHWPQDRFITLLYAELDRDEMSVTLVNAGHRSPLLRDRHGVVSQLGEGGYGPPLNVTESHRYESVTIPLELGELLLFYSNGVVDATNNAQERFGQTRLEEVFGKARLDPGDAGEAVLKAVDQFVKDGPQTDDLALVCFGRWDR